MTDINNTFKTYMKEFKMPKYTTYNPKDNRVRNKFDYLLNSYDTDKSTITNTYDIIKKNLPRTL